MQVVEPVPDASFDGHRRQLSKVLASTEFAGSRQLQDFLSYIAAAAFANKKHLDQIEIARCVLNRGEDFNPVDDASVRKLATLTRQRLERYYAGSGAGDAVLIALPMRSYIPTFQERSESEPIAESGTDGVVDAVPPVVAEPAVAETRRFLGRSTVLLLVLAGVAAGAGSAWFAKDFWRPAPPAESPQFRFKTVYGDFMHNKDDISGGIIQAGPSIGAADEVAVRLRFRPERALHQAGLLIIDDADHYIKLGRQFESRTQLEFGLELDGRYQKTPHTFSYDRYAQNGEPIWLSIRREASKFLAFRSGDGVVWQPVGEPLESPKAMRNPRAALFASNGRTAVPSVEASFDHFTYGLAFHDRPNGPLDLASFPGWRTDSACRTLSIDDGWLSFLPREEAACRTALLRPVPQGDWTLSALVDCMPLDGNVAALVLRGKKGEVRLIRWDISGAAVTFEQLEHGQSTLPDFAGSPPLILRLECRGGIVRASFSRDDKEYFTLPLSVKMSDLGPDVRMGLQAGKSTWTKQAGEPPKFAWIRLSVLDLAPFH